MAILIGVIALAVIPNIQRSRESKDISFLDSVASATNAAIANNQVTSSGEATLYKFAADGKCVDTGADTTAIAKAVRQTIAENPTLGSSAATDGGGIIYAKWTIPTDGAASITVSVATDAKASKATKYLSDPAKFEVKN